METHHTHLAGQLAGRVSVLLETAARNPAAAAAARAALVAFCERELLPHASAEEAVLYPPARATTEGRLLVEAMLAERRRLAALVEGVRKAPGTARAAADARALQVLFEEHLEKENTLMVPLLAGSPEVSLAGLLAGMHDILGPAAAAGTADAAPAGGCGGGGQECGCGGSDGDAVPELDVRTVPHALRHATVFGALDAVPAGSAMVLVAPHDPLPLLAQIEDRAPGAFAVDYLERGPEAWRLRLTHR
ncbi:DUF2249 domain-containing protein [Streptomyces sp. YIM 98790]|uniref:DUF2249 domain-containing protein n=1 Tax=Streptomyces sp. YIM 98790 TaxID=2689077 RepID=UPI0028BF07BB|nr:DUF2249 domain-containing protein [Streptomyces sp. YIM 98790]